MPETPLESPIGGDDMGDENNIVKLLRSWMTGVQDVESALQQLKLNRSIDTATGVQLDILGKIVGQARAGNTDDTYRRYIRARIRANRSRGCVPDVIGVADLVVNDAAATLTVKQVGSATYVLRVDGVAFSFANSLVLLELVDDATSAGVRVIVESNADVPASAFNFAADGGGDADGLGFGSLPQLDLAPLTANIETVVRHRDSRIPTLALVADGVGAGTWTTVGDAWTFHFESGVTTVAQFEAALAADPGTGDPTAFVVLTSDGVGTLDAGDALAATAFARPVTGGKMASAISA